MALWELVPEETWSREVVRRFAVPPDGSNYGNITDQFLKPPQVTHVFTGQGFTKSDLDTIIAAQSRGATYMVTDKLGNSYTGTLLSLTRKNLNGSVYFSAVLTLRI